MVTFKAIIQQFEEKGEKTGWTYIDVPADRAQELIPGNKKAFRVKGKLDSTSFSFVSLLPMGNGKFIMALNASIRKKIRKGKGAEIVVSMEVDKKEAKPPAELMECLADEPKALAYFQSLPKGHQQYFANWINSAKTEPTKVKRVAQAVNALARNMGYGEMIREAKKVNSEW